MEHAEQARYAQLQESQGVFVVALLDENRREIGHGYRGPTLKRAEQDLRYWTKTKGLKELTS